MTKISLLSTAAALLLAAGAASAQTVKKDEAPTPAPAAQQNAPAEKVAPSMHVGQHKAQTTGQATTSSEPEINKSKSPKDKAMSKGAMEKSEGTNKSASGKMNANESATIKSKSANESAQTTSKNANENAQMKSNDKTGTASSNASSKPSSATTGQGAAAGAAKLSTEQRTKITAIIKEQKVQPTHLNVSVTVGTRVPTSVHLYPVPVEVVDIYPEWRGFDYILVGDEIVIIDPHSHEIVAIITA